MNDAEIAMNPNRIVQYLGKPQEEFTKEDLIKFIEENEIKMLNFRHVGGRLKILNFAVITRAQLVGDGWGACWESAECLLGDGEIYQRDGVFPSVAIDGIVKKLRSYDDKGLSERLSGKEDEIKKLVGEYLHCS